MRKTCLVFHCLDSYLMVHIQSRPIIIKSSWLHVFLQHYMLLQIFALGYKYFFFPFNSTYCNKRHTGECIFIQNIDWKDLFFPSFSSSVFQLNEPHSCCQKKQSNHLFFFLFSYLLPTLRGMLIQIKSPMLYFEQICFQWKGRSHSPQNFTVSRSNIG